MIQCEKSDGKYLMTVHEISISGTLVLGQDEPGVISQGKTAYASSNENAVFVPENVLDGDLNTRWSSIADDNQWIVIDLEENYVVTGLNLNWETAYASNYTVYTSIDGETWSHEGTYNIGAAGEVSHRIDSQVARYVKIQGYTRATQYGISLFEVEVLGYK